MKHLFLPTIAIITALLTACGAQKRDVAPIEPSAAADSLQAIYNDVLAAYNGEKTATQAEIDTRYLTADYNALIQQVEAADEAIEADGMIGFFDYDHWLFAQDYGELLATVDRCEYVGDSVYLAEISLKNFGSVQKIEVSLTLENGRCLIDDMRPLRNEKSERERMREYLKS
jgi:hypothetical protein